MGDEIYIGLNPNPGDLYVTAHQIGHSLPSSIDNVQGKQTARFQVDVFSTSSLSASTAADAVIDAVHLKADDQNGHNIQFMRVENISADYEPDTKLFRKVIPVSVFFD